LKSDEAGYELVASGMERWARIRWGRAIMDAPQVANAISRIFDKRTH